MCHVLYGDARAAYGGHVMPANNLLINHHKAKEITQPKMYTTVTVPYAVTSRNRACIYYWFYVELFNVPVSLSYVCLDTL